MRTRILSIVLTCCALAVGVASAQSARGRGPDHKQESADSHPEPRQPFKWWANEQYKQELKLTADQAARIEKVFESSMERLRGDKDDLDRAQATFSELMEKPSAPDLDFSRAVDRLELARYNVSKERTTMLVRIHSILTPEQRKGLEAIRKRNDPRNDPRNNGDKNRPH